MKRGRQGTWMNRAASVHTLNIDTFPHKARCRPLCPISDLFSLVTGETRLKATSSLISGSSARRGSGARSRHVMQPLLLPNFNRPLKVVSCPGTPEAIS